MRSTFRVLFYTKNQSIKNGKVPVMGRITINKTTACFSCKKEVSISLWDAKANRAKGKSEEARMLNQELDNAKAQIAKHYQYICDHDSFVTAKKVYSRYVGFKEDSHTLMELFREQLESYKEKVGKEKAKSTYLGLVADYKSALLFLKDKKNVEDIALDELDKDFIEDYYNWMLGTCGSASSTAFGRVNTMKWLMHIAQEKGLIKVHPFTGFGCKPGYKRRSFLSEEELQRLIHVELRYKRQQAMRDMLLFMCFTGLRYSDLKQLKWGNIEKSQSGMVIRIEAMKKTEKPVTVPLGTNAMAWLPERGDKTLDDFVFDLGTCGGCNAVLKNMAKRAGINKRVSFHTGRHSFATLTLAATNDIATVSRLLGHTSVATTQIYAEVLMEDKIAAVNKLNGIF